MGVQQEQGIVIFSMEEETKIVNWKEYFCTPHNYQQQRAEFVSCTVLHIVLRGRWCNIIVLNAHAPSEDKSDDS